MLTVTPYEVRLYPEKVLYRIVKMNKRFTISVYAIAFVWQLERLKAKMPSKDNYRLLLVGPDKVEIWHCESCLKNDRLVFTVETHYAI